VPDAIEHALAFLGPIPSSASRLIDLGSGGGLPGLVLAHERAFELVTLVERRERRADLLRLACGELGLSGRVEVECRDAVEMGSVAPWRRAYDVVTARAFGAPAVTLRVAEAFLRDRGIAVVSDPPDVDPSVRWPEELVAAAGLVRMSPAFPRVSWFRRA
jgi:16S rRNA (guanine527-N7)-methyltransferase